MGLRFGWDFSAVRVHASPADARVASAVGARAFASGTQIVFGAGAYAPGTAEGDRLIAHELVHVIQRQRFASVPLGHPVVSLPHDAAEREADRIADGGRPDVREALTAMIARQTLAPTAPAVFLLFEDSAASTPAGAKAAFDKYLKLTKADQEKALGWSYATGKLQSVLAALGPAGSAEPKYATPVRDILRWIEETETRKTTGKTDKEMAKTQAGVIPPLGSGPSGWGGAKGKTRWQKLTDAGRRQWTGRGHKAIAAMVAHAKTAAPELGVTTATFELAFEAVDHVWVGSMGTVGSIPGKTVRIGFEFIAVAEVNPAYALPTVAHELKGHPIYNQPGGGASTYAGKIYRKAASRVPATKKVDRSGEETFDYWTSEIYSLLKEIPYYTPVTQKDAAIDLKLPANPSRLARLNYDPRGEIRKFLEEIKKRWEPSLVNGIVRGFYKRISADPSMKKASVTEFQKIVKSVFPADAAAILK